MRNILVRSFSLMLIGFLFLSFSSVALAEEQEGPTVSEESITTAQKKIELVPDPSLYKNPYQAYPSDEKFFSKLQKKRAKFIKKIEVEKQKFAKKIERKKIPPQEVQKVTTKFEQKQLAKIQRFQKDQFTDTKDYYERMNS